MRNRPSAAATRGPALWLAAVIPAIIVAVVTCSDSSSTTPGAADSGNAPATVGPGECPDVAPKPGDGCVLPEGTTCAFGCSLFARCAKGVWSFGGNVASTSCPTDYPVSGSACSCFPATIACNYGSTDCSAPDASTNRSVASCPNGTWVIETFPCSDASSVTPPADAGADVQGDAAAEAD